MIRHYSPLFVFIAVFVGCGSTSPRVQDVDKFVDVACASIPALEAAGLKGEAYEYLERACKEGVVDSGTAE